MRLSIKLGTLSAANIGISFLFHWYVIIQLGPGVESDAFFASATLPQLALVVVSGSLLHVLVPLFAGEKQEDLQRDAWAFLFLIGGSFGVVAITLAAIAPWWVPAIVPGFHEAAQSLTVELARIQLMGMVFAGITAVQSATYHARQRFLWAEFAPILASAVAFGLLVWALPRFGVVAAAWIAAIRMAVQAALLTPGMGAPVRPNIGAVAIQQAWQRLKPLLLGTSYYKSDVLVDRFLLSSAPSGSLSLFYLAQQIYGAVSQVLHKAIAVPLVPILSILHKAGSKYELRARYRRKMLQVGGLSVAGLLVFVIGGHEVVALFVAYGNVSTHDATELWWIMIWLAGMFVGGTVGQVAASSFYACGDTVTPTRMSMITYTAYIPAKVIAFYLWGVAGLAISTSVYYVANLLLQIYLFERKHV